MSSSKFKSLPLVHSASPELSSTEILAVVEPLPAELAAPFSVWLDEELTDLEFRFRQFSTPRSLSVGLGR